MSSVIPQPRFPANRVVYSSPDDSSVFVFLNGVEVSSSALRFLGASDLSSSASSESSESSESSSDSSEDWIMVSYYSLTCGWLTHISLYLGTTLALLGVGLLFLGVGTRGLGVGLSLLLSLAVCGLHIGFSLLGIGLFLLVLLVGVG